MILSLSEEAPPLERGVDRAGSSHSLGGLASEKRLQRSRERRLERQKSGSRQSMVPISPGWTATKRAVNASRGRSKSPIPGGGKAPVRVRSIVGKNEISKADPDTLEQKHSVTHHIHLTANRRLYIKASEENRRRLLEAIMQDSAGGCESSSENKGEE